MHPQVTAPIDESYTAYSHSVDTLEMWYNENLVVGDLAVSSQVLFPTFVTFYVVIFFIFVLELKPYKFGKKLNHELKSEIHSIRAEAQSKLLTQVTISILFHILTLAADGAALAHYTQLPENVEEYYYNEPKRFWSVPITMAIFDFLTFVIFIIVPLALSKKNKYKLTYALISPFSCLTSHGYHIVFAFIHDPYHATSILLLYGIILFLHIQGFQKLFYFVNSIDIWGENNIIDNDFCTEDMKASCCYSCCSSIYDCCCCICRCFFHGFQCCIKCCSRTFCWCCYIVFQCCHFIFCCCGKCISADNLETWCRNDCPECCCKRLRCCRNLVVACCVYCCKRIGLYGITIIIYTIEFLFMATSIGISLALIILLPISNAIDDAPNRLYVIYQASVTFFAALIAFKLLFRQNKSILGVFIKAMAARENLQPEITSESNEIKLKDYCKYTTTKAWPDMSENEKEIYLANQILSQFAPNVTLKLKKQDLDSVVTSQSSESTTETGERASSTSTEQGDGCCCTCWPQHNNYELVPTNGNSTRDEGPNLETEEPSQNGTDQSEQMSPTASGQMSQTGGETSTS